MIEYLPQALSSLSTALSIAKRLVGIRDSAKLQEAVVEFNSAIIDAQSKIISSQTEQTNLLAKINELEQECKRLKNWDNERQKYSRKEIADGVFAYIENNFTGKFQNAHKYCCNCFDNFKKSTLQQSYDYTMHCRIRLSCHNKCPDLIFNNYKD